jgi:succinate dehydrogenase / fumarate reductase membrane anchor subunit
MIRPRIVPQRGFNLDYLMWLFTRISGLAIILLSLIGIGAALYMGARTQMDLPTFLRWAFFPNPNHVVNSNIPDVTVGWANAFWQIMSMLIVFFAFTHAANGLRMIVEDYLGHSFWQLIFRGVLFLLWLFMTIVAIYVILSS